MKLDNSVSLFFSIHFKGVILGLDVFNPNAGYHGNSTPTYVANQYSPLNHKI